MKLIKLLCFCVMILLPAVVFGQASAEPYPANNTVVPVTTVDKQIADRKLEGPYLLKLDTHGYEIPILKGAANTIMQSEVIVIECYNYKIATECLLFYDMCKYLEEKNFRCIDLVDVMHRPHDKSLWQMDLIFIKKSREEFLCQSYELVFWHLLSHVIY